MKKLQTFAKTFYFQYFYLFALDSYSMPHSILKPLVASQLSWDLGNDLIKEVDK